MKTSASGELKIRDREGQRLVAYYDTEGVLTIGVGHTGRMSDPKVTAGMTITQAQCDALLAADLAPVEAAINKALKVPVSQNEFDAMVSLWFNAVGYVSTSAIIKRLNLGDIAGAAAGFDAYHKPASIIGRRNGEKAQFLEPDAETAGLRAQVLTSRSTAAKAKAKRTQSGGAAVAAGGAAAVVAAGSTNHHTVAWIVFAVVAIGVAIDAAVAVINHAKSATLASNAVAQAAVAKTATPPAAAPAAA